MLYDISDVCRLFNWTPSGIRYFEEIGLLHPMRTESGRRKYSEEEMRRLLHIKMLRSYNMSLEEIRTYFMNDTTASSQEISAVLDQKIQQLEAQILTLRSTQKAMRQYAELMRKPGDALELAYADAFPESYALYLKPLFGKNPAQYKGLSQWIALVPSVKRCIHYETDGPAVVSQRDCFLVEKTAADANHLPFLAESRQVPGGDALRLCFQLPHDHAVHGIGDENLASLARSACSRLSCKGLHIFATYLFGNMKDGTRQKLYDIWCVPRQDE